MIGRIGGGQRWRRPGGRRIRGLEAGGFVGDGREDQIGSQRLCGFADSRETIGRTVGPEAGGFAALRETNGVSEDRRLRRRRSERPEDRRPVPGGLAIPETASETFGDSCGGGERRWRGCREERSSA